MASRRKVLEPFLPAGGSLLTLAFFDRPAEVVARGLLGKVLVTSFGNTLTAGTIVETEAYLGSDDPGSHAATRGITARNRVMYGPPGHAYVYFTYGNHHMLNFVTCAEGTAGAVLVRAVEPSVGLDAMRARRAGREGVDLTNGPGKVAQAFGIDLRHNGVTLAGDLAVYDGPAPCSADVATSGRIGLGTGHDLPLRFFVRTSPYVSKGRTGPRVPKRRPEGREET